MPHPHMFVHVCSVSLHMANMLELWDVRHDPTLGIHQVRPVVCSRFLVMSVTHCEKSKELWWQLLLQVFFTAILQHFQACLHQDACGSRLIMWLVDFVQIGGVRAPSPVGELGNVEMTQSLNVIEPQWQGIGPDMLLTGYLPASGGLEALDAALSGQPSLSPHATAHQANGSSQPGLSSDPTMSRVEARRRSSSDTNKVS